MCVTGLYRASVMVFLRDLDRFHGTRDAIQMSIDTLIEKV